MRKVIFSVDSFAKANDDGGLGSRLETLRLQAELHRRNSAGNHQVWLKGSEDVAVATAQCLGYLCALMKYDVITVSRYECFYCDVVDIARGKGVVHD